MTNISKSSLCFSFLYHNQRVTIHQDQVEAVLLHVLPSPLHNIVPIPQTDPPQFKNPTKQLKTKTQLFAANYFFDETIWQNFAPKKIEISKTVLEKAYSGSSNQTYGCKNYLQSFVFFFFFFGSTINQIQSLQNLEPIS